MFDPSALEFLVDLSINNRRDWFEANKARYEASVRQPALRFIRAMAGPLSEFAPHFEASDKAVGGSLMRVHRDTRFAKDKAPYKTNVGIQFRHEAGKDVHAPGFYLHLAPDEVFVGVGAWHPDAPTLAAFRKRILDRPEDWSAASRAAAFRGAFKLAGESLRSVPKGFDREHPHAEDLKRKDHIAVANLSAEQLYGAEGFDRVAEKFRIAAPYMKFLLDALALPI